jgi:hypothetical protein
MKILKNRFSGLQILSIFDSTERGGRKKKLLPLMNKTVELTVYYSGSTTKLFLRIPPLFRNQGNRGPS